MIRRMQVTCVVLLALTAPGAAPAWSDRSASLGIELWTDRGNDAVYQPGQNVQVQVRASDDAYLLVYEIDAEGLVRSLYPYRDSEGFIEGRRTYAVPPEGSDLELVVQGSVGQSYIVAIASRDPLRELPWYLRPFDARGENLGYVGYDGEDLDEEGVTREGRIVGDPFVAMERIRRAVLGEPDDPESFATAYTSYYVHQQVRYPRYLCYDCHRPNYWAWWDGFDPYYTTCSVFDFRVNWGWGWGPRYWYGALPYYYYVVRPDCPPRYRTYYRTRAYYSSWDGWGRWRTLWGGRLTRYKSDPPSGYVPPSKYKERGVWRNDKPVPPGLLVKGNGERTRPLAGFVPRGRDQRLDDPSGPRGSRFRDGERPSRTPEGRNRSTRPLLRRGDEGWSGAVRRFDRPSFSDRTRPNELRSGGPRERSSGRSEWRSGPIPGHGRMDREVVRDRGAGTREWRGRQSQGGRSLEWAGERRRASIPLGGERPGASARAGRPERPRVEHREPKRGNDAPPPGRSEASRGTEGHGRGHGRR